MQHNNIQVQNQAVYDLGQIGVINRGQVKVTGIDGIKGEAGIPLPVLGGPVQPKSNLSAAGSNVLGNTKTLLKKKSETTEEEAANNLTKQNPFNHRKTTASYQPSDELPRFGPIEEKPREPQQPINDMDNSDSDDFDAFYKDRSFLNAGMNKQQKQQSDWYQDNSDYYPGNLNRVSFTYLFFK